jgi:hypothetical protein
VEPGVRPQRDAAAEIEDPSRVGRRGEQAPVVVVDSLLEAERRAVEAMRVVPGEGGAVQLERELLEGPLGQPARTSGCSGRASTGLRSR